MAVTVPGLLKTASTGATRTPPMVVTSEEKVNHLLL